MFDLVPKPAEPDAPRMPSFTEIMAAFSNLRPLLADSNPAVYVYHLDAEHSPTRQEAYFIEVFTGARAFRITEVDPELGERVSTWPDRAAVHAFLTSELMRIVKLAGVPVVFRECTDQHTAR